MIQAFLDSVANILDPIILALVIMSGLFQDSYTKPFVLIKKDEKYNSALKTLILSTIFVLAYIFFIGKENSDEPKTYVRWFVSYVVATSIYELVISPIRGWIKRKAKEKFGTDTPPTTP